MDYQRRQPLQGLSSQEKMVQGSAWMSAGNIFSRLLGAIYIIPWYFWMGEHAKEANALFNMGYTVYALFLMISTAGIPGAIAKQTARFNSRGEYKTSWRLFVRALQLAASLGVVFSVLMYLASPLLADLSGGGQELIPAMRALSLAILAFPCMSVIRGYFQGNQNMKPFALSQIIEQVIRVFYMLISAFIIMQVLKGDYVTAVTQSSLAAFVGMLGGFVLLIFYLKKDQPRLEVYIENSREDTAISTKELLLATIKEAVPFIVIGTGITLFKLVDFFSFLPIMKGHTNYSKDQLMELYSIFSANPDKLTMVIIALATAISLTGLPLITEMATQRRQKELAKLVSNNLQLFVFVMLPAIIGMILLAYPLNTLFYTPDSLGTKVLIEACLAAFPMGLYMIVSVMLQGLDQNVSAMKYLGFGFLAKLLLQVPLVRLLEVYGPLMATMIGFSITCLLTLRKIRHVTGFNAKLTWRRCLLIVILTIIMWLFALVTRQITTRFLSVDNRLQSFGIIFLTSLVGGGIYVYLAMKIRLADVLAGPKMKNFRRKLRIK